jgi:hypothetical protein
MSPIESQELHEELRKCRDSVEGDIKDWLVQHEKAEFDKHDQLRASIKDLTLRVEELGGYFEQGKGAITALKWLAVIVTGVWAVMLWAKDHVKL